MQYQAAESENPNGLLADIIAEEPRFENRIKSLQQEYRSLLQQFASLQEQFSQSETNELNDFADIRQRLALLLTAVRHHQPREYDLIFEAISTDIGALD